MIAVFLVLSLGAGHQHSQFEYSVPQYDSEEEILVYFLIPFITLYLFLFLASRRFLHFVLADEDAPPWEKPDVNIYAALIALVITASTIVSPVWNYTSWLIQSIGLVFVLMIVGAVLLFLYYTL